MYGQDLTRDRGNSIEYIHKYLCKYGCVNFSQFNKFLYKKFSMFYTFFFINNCSFFSF